MTGYNKENTDNCPPPHFPDCNEQGEGGLFSSIPIPCLTLLPQLAQEGEQREEGKVGANTGAHGVEGQVRLLLIV